MADTRALRALECIIRGGSSPLPDTNYRFTINFIYARIPLCLENFLAQLL